MFLRQRVLIPEYTDAPGLSFDEVARNYRQLSRINRLFLFADPFLRILPTWLGEEPCRSMTILDLGAGDGSLGRTLETGAAKRGWKWRVTSLDLNPLALRLNPGGYNVAASVTALPFPDDSFALVIASQRTHHLDADEDVIRHFQEAWRVSRDIVFLNDVHRSPFLYVFLWFWLRACGYSRPFREDGLASIRRGWLTSEWEKLAKAAGIPHPEVWLYYRSRVILQARKRDR